MQVIFSLEDGGDEIYSFNTSDVKGVLEASKGERVVFQDDHYEYASHTLNHYNDYGVWKQHLIIYLKEYDK